MTYDMQASCTNTCSVLEHVYNSRPAFDLNNVYVLRELVVVGHHLCRLSGSSDVGVFEIKQSPVMMFRSCVAYCWWPWACNSLLKD